MLPTLDVLLPQGLAPIGPADVDRLDALHAEPRLPWLRANMIASLDGAATGADGRSGSINGPADHRVFEVLRARADVVLIGAETVRTEGYRAARTPDPLLPGRRARGQADHPPLAVVTASGSLPDEMLTDEPAPFVVTTDACPELARLRRLLPADRLLVHDAAVDLPRAVAQLTAAAGGRLLTEGGPHLLRELVGARLVDELCLTWSPVLVGGPAPRALAGGAWLTPALAAAPAHLLHAGGMLIGRWLLTRGGAATAADTLSV